MMYFPKGLRIPMRKLTENERMVLVIFFGVFMLIVAWIYNDRTYEERFAKYRKTPVAMLHQQNAPEGYYNCLNGACQHVETGKLFVASEGASGTVNH